MKKLVCAVLVITMVLTFCVPMVSADETEPAFDTAQIRHMIDVNLSTGNTDEEFFRLLTDAYIADPALLAVTIADMSQDEIIFLAKAISYDLQKRGAEDLAYVPLICDAPEVARLIYQEVQNEENSSMETLAAVMAQLVPLEEAVQITYIMDETAERNQTRVVTDLDSVQAYAPTTVSGMTAPVTATAVSVSIGTHVGSAQRRLYTVKVYKRLLVDSGSSATDYEVSSVLVPLPAYAISASAQCSVVFNQVGLYEIYSEVYDSSNNLVSTSQATMVRVALWHITVELTEDRSELGTITLYDGTGNYISHSRCLGQSDSNAAMNVEFGNTPIGIYYGYLYGPYTDTERYGQHKVISMWGIAGYITDDSNERDEIMIHGGRESYYAGMDEDDPNFRLCVTEGCVRITNEYQEHLEEQITALTIGASTARGIVVITQDGEYELTEG